MNPIFNKPYTFDRVVRIVFSLVIIGAVIYLLSVLKNALLPFLVAWLFAYLLQPIVKFIQYKLRFKSRILSIAVVLLLMAGLLALLTVLVVPSIAQETEKTLELFRNYNLEGRTIPFIPEAWLHYLQEHINIDEWMTLLSRDNILNAIKQLAPKLWYLLSNTFSVLFSITIIFVILLYFIFILLDYEKIANSWRLLVPDKYRPFVEGLADDVKYSMNRYFRGQSLVALCVGVLLAIGFRIINFPLGVTLGLFIGLLNLIPYLQTIGIIPMILLSLLRSAETGQSFWLIFGLSLLVLGIVQVIQDLILVPKIMGQAMGLNPAFILLSLSIWGTLLGFIGFIVALPLTTLCLSYYRRFILMEGEEYAKIVTPEPDEEEEIKKTE
ncbi:putative PurR-regulated permease PerM [Parabacteroides sp. PFB2-12]|uniref:AI-2E family transporter n=1 Tax=unclassified Parabacteroides TaxID=2649774 RepID=UPI0024748219|nr:MULTISPECIES: AI-2E family transporter [unclassified Parabacteroides]MDH6343876.1 putative PurR-regulated permease PerM [Parabacteroides sp. PM6-13]MDH6391238.1 putative PurR-regulated permease PerM [Parabacteroides sp. PFB2-12]